MTYEYDGSVLQRHSMSSDLNQRDEQMSGSFLSVMSYLLTCDVVLTVCHSFSLPTPTNVLSFYPESNFLIDQGFLGEIAICPQIIDEEAKKFGKSFESRLYHLTSRANFQYLFDKCRTFVFNQTVLAQ